MTEIGQVFRRSSWCDTRSADWRALRKTQTGFGQLTRVRNLIKWHFELTPGRSQPAGGMILGSYRTFQQSRFCDKGFIRRTCGAQM